MRHEGLIDAGGGRVVGALFLAVAGALALSAATLAAGHGFMLALLAYLLAGTATAALALAGGAVAVRAEHPGRRPGAGAA